ncbi:C4-dicarboxylate ABC transporter [Sphingopyxis sp. H038]|uniref:dicarboxylate/amino acid:cation symporter n=1 Tax=unclassified Sphingopyxis TaxID=2614943 RepID=UPI000730BE63|nr:MULTISPECIES: dicarboxylate/amino acid:cation symporter [unclassified Sphingopyxis]KTD99415.1 C4-dicarboxylate ABC transporter [Sphingopyxis sp. H012]KTE04070.1 C4-dicarboxylate ABC transporter [Sphingopyxis sp. H093]KTE12391.1 C4-dicarboxylate ABC transporter [Sphingopyxis sp. H053]KTE18210.1 C4-dicarboxylate ABC transporter [Sphingopyxis sp. H080]KTE32448.1 C4-dicarboxylate ABC transporter [Sphingopyxis sp. H038]
MGHRLTFYILIGMILGVITGYLVRVYVPADSEAFTYWLRSFSTLSTIFLNLIKLVVAPLILGTLVAGIAHMGDSSALGRIGTRAIAWFILASLISISLGLIMVNFFEPGAGLNLTVGAHSIAEVGEVKKLDLFEFIEHVFPKNIFQAMADNNVLQILVFALFAGVGLTAIGDKGKPLVRGAEALAELMLQITGYVMRLAPIAVFGALAGVVAKYGLGILGTYAELVTEFYLSLVVLWVILLGAGAIFLGRRIFALMRYIRQPLLIAFSTASSEAAMPKLFEQLDRFGVPRRISGFVLPLGYSFNLDGSMMYASFATLFIAQAYGIELSITQQILILLTLMVSSKGIAAVPRASLVVITATLAMFDLPVEGVALIFAIDQFLDMGRTATNVVGNAVATSVITKWEGMLEAPEAPDLERPHAPAHTPHHGTRGLDLRDDIAGDEKKPAADNA